jgi:hypothetical protein
MFLSSVQKARIGIPALCVLFSGFIVDFAVNGGRDCFTAPEKTFAFRCGQVAIVAMLASGVAAIVGLLTDRQKWYAGIALVCTFPLLIIDALRMGCW